MPKIGTIIYGIVSAAAIGYSVKSCCDNDRLVQERLDNIEARVESYMENRPHVEFIDIKKKAMLYDNTGAYMQSSLDSLAYREIFTSSQVAADSAAVAEFNKLASSMRINRKESPYKPLRSDLYDKLSKMVTHKQFKQIENESEESFLTLQFKADSVAYRRFFEKHGLLNDSTLRKITAVAKKIRP